ncbi:MAG: hypothetical protein MZU79_09040 [Anaerotruncus sp.]|nr:hypothetical protein [Anaerotruncus sp.]
MIQGHGREGLASTEPRFFKDEGEDNRLQVHRLRAVHARVRGGGGRLRHIHAEQEP